MKDELIESILDLEYTSWMSGIGKGCPSEVSDARDRTMKLVNDLFAEKEVEE